MTVINLIFGLALIAPPLLLGFTWWGWFRRPQVQPRNWRTITFFSSLCAGTVNFLLVCTWAVWLHYHYNPESWRVWDNMSNVGLCLLLYSFIAAIAGKGKYRYLVAISSFLSLILWIPVGIL